MKAGRAPCGALLTWDEVAVCSKHGVDCIDPDRLARALHRLEPGPYWNDVYIDVSFGLGWHERGTVHRNARDLAAAIVKAYEEEG